MDVQYRKYREKTTFYRALSIIPWFCGVVRVEDCRGGRFIVRSLPEVFMPQYTALFVFNLLKSIITIIIMLRTRFMAADHYQFWSPVSSPVRRGTASMYTNYLTLLNSSLNNIVVFTDRV
jgi:hypothetical protein